jgi:phage portal protein BeeE
MALFNPNGWLGQALFGKNYFYKSQSVQLGNKGAVYIDTDKPYELYHSIPQLKTIIGKKKAMFANVVPILKGKDGVAIEGALANDFYNLIYSPNVMQSFNELMENQLEQFDVYGNQFTYKNKVSNLSKFPIALWNISPRYMSPVMTGKVFDQVAKVDVISSYEYCENTTKKVYSVTDIMYMRHNDLDNPVIGTSPLKFLKHPLSNIDGAYKFRNVLINEKGAIGILSNSTKDSMGGMPLTTPEREKIEKAHRQNYGINDEQMRLIITDASMTWTPMSYPTKDMMLFEEIAEDTLVLIDHFGMNVNLFASKNATFENVTASIKQVYADTIQPYADKYFTSLTAFLEIEKLFGKGAYIEGSYEHLKILQENKKEGAELFKSNVESVSQLVTSQIITPQQGNVLLNNMASYEIPTI